MDVEKSSGWLSLGRRADEALWNDRVSRPFAARIGIRLVRVLVVAVLAFQDRMLNLHAMGLVYATLLSLVPFLAVTVSVLEAFGDQYRLQPLLTRLLDPLGPQAADVTQRVVDFVSRMNIGVLGALGVAGLFYTVVSLISKVEAALNDIWNVRRSRGLPRKFSASSRSPDCRPPRSSRPATSCPCSSWAPPSRSCTASCPTPMCA